MWYYVSVNLQTFKKFISYRYKIVPVNDSNFGPLAVGAKKMKTITVENIGEFEFKYMVCKMIPLDTSLQRHKVLHEDRVSRSREGIGSGKRLARRESLSSGAGTQYTTPKPAPVKQMRWYYFFRLNVMNIFNDIYE